MRLAVLAEVGPVGVDDCSGVVEDPGLFLLVHRQDEDHAEFLGQCLEALRRGAGDGLGVLVELDVLDLAEVGPVEQLLEAHHLCTMGSGLPSVVLVGDDHRLLVAGPARLHERRSHHTHRRLPGAEPLRPPVTLMRPRHGCGRVGQGHSLG